MKEAIHTDQSCRGIGPYSQAVKVDFVSLSWEEPAAGVRSKVAIRGSKRLRLAEFRSEFSEQDWCFKSHVGYVLEGEMEIDFADRTERFRTGDGIFILAGEEERHRAKVISPVVKLIVVEDA